MESPLDSGRVATVAGRKLETAVFLHWRRLRVSRRAPDRGL